MTGPLAMRRVVTLHHLASGRRLPVEVPTVFGRSATYYRYRDDDQRGDRLREDVARRLSALNYVQLISDESVSRTHGLLDPVGPTLRDLNSSNGSYVNGRELATRAGEPGAPAALANGDRIDVGKQAFVVEVTEVPVSEVEARAQALRTACVCADERRRERGQQLAAFLESRKGFAVRRARGWPALITNLYELQASADADGLVVCAVHGEVVAEEVRLDGGGLAFDKLVPLLERVPGRKVLVLDGEGDPAACERRFADLASESMLLLTSQGGRAPAEGAEVQTGLHTLHAEAVRLSVSGQAPLLRGAFDDARDGLDAMVSPDTNILAVGWLAGYRGRLQVTFGLRPCPDTDALSHSLQAGSATFRL